MSSSLSDDEFHRLQLQLLELRTTNYEIDAKQKKQEREIQVLNQKLEQSDRDLQKANKAIQKSKKAKEVEILIQENDNLQRKLESQEEEFKLQNHTLMQELTSLVTSNEAFEKKIKELEGGGVPDALNSSVLSEADDEIRHLKAQNSVLQKNLNSLKDKYAKQTKSATSSPEIETNTEPSENSETINESQSCAPETSDIKSGYVHTDANNEEITKEINDLKLNLETKEEENKLLREQFLESENNFKEKIATLQQELDEAKEKFTRKQESYLILQKEKEDIFKTANSKSVELQEARERDKGYYQNQIVKLQQEVERLKSESDNVQTNSKSTISYLQSQIASMQTQVDAANIVEKQHINEQNEHHMKKIAELQQHLSSLEHSKNNLTVQIDESNKLNKEISEQLLVLQKDRDSKIQEWQEMNKVAEKRKSMLDELANTYQRDSAIHQDKIRQLEDQLETEVNEFKEQLKSEKVRNSEFEKLKQQVDNLKQQLTSAEEAKGWLERRLEDSESNLSNTKEEKTTSLEALKTEHELQVLDINQVHNTELETVKAEYEEKILLCGDAEKSLEEQVKILETEMSKLKQDLKDGVDAKKIHEKKGMTALKDLKKQLHQERKRAEKLQNKLQEILSDPKHVKGIDDLLSGFDGNDSMDRSSVSSWSGGASLVREHSGLSVSGTSSIHSPDRDRDLTLTSPTKDMHNSLEQEHSALVNKVASMQQEKWDMEEKVSHLEMSTAAMAEDLIQKTKIIEHYVMESRTDPKPKSHSPQEDKMSFKKVLDKLDLVNKTEGQDIKEMNRKLQRMLEETLTKNMHLQNNLQTLSEEIVRLSKTDESRKENGSASGSVEPPK